MQSQKIINYYNSEIEKGNLNAQSELAAFYDEIGDRKKASNAYLNDKIHKSRVVRHVVPIAQTLFTLENTSLHDSFVENVLGLTPEQNSQKYKEFVAMLCE